MLAERRHRVHAWLGADPAGRQQGRDAAGGRVNLAPAPARLKLDMAPEIRHFVHLRIGNARPIQPRNNLRRGQF